MCVHYDLNWRVWNTLVELCSSEAPCQPRKWNALDLERSFIPLLLFYLLRCQWSHVVCRVGMHLLPQISCDLSPHISCIHCEFAASMKEPNRAIISTRSVLSQRLRVLGAYTRSLSQSIVSAFFRTICWHFNRFGCMSYRLHVYINSILSLLAECIFFVYWPWIAAWISSQHVL